MALPSESPASARRLQLPKRTARWGIRGEALFLEPGMQLSDAAVRAVAEAIQRCAAWHGTPKVRLGRAESEGMWERLRGALMG